MENNSGLNIIADIVNKYDDIRKKLKRDVVGQDQAIDSIIDSIVNSIVFNDDSDPRPRGLFLFAGSPGVGKTYLATKCAEYMGMDCQNLNMSAYGSKEASSINLFGIDPVYRGASQGTLIQFVEKQKNKPCIIILDELEKASSDVILQFLQIFESGKTDNLFVKGVKNASSSDVERHHWEWALHKEDYVSFKNVYFFITTNAGRPLYENGKQPAPDITKEVIIDAIRNDINPATNNPYFPDAILSRFQTGTVVMFRHLNTNELVRIGTMEMLKNIELIDEEYGLDIEVYPDVITLLLLKEGGCVDARNFRKIAEAFLRDRITEICGTLKEGLFNTNKVKIEVDPDEKESLDTLLYGEQREQNIIIVGENEGVVNLIYRIAQDCHDINPRRTTNYDEALKMLGEEIFDTPIIFALMPSTRNDSGLTVASNNSAIYSRNMKGFRDFIDNVKEYNEKTTLYVIDFEHSSPETKNDIISKGVTEIFEFDNKQAVLNAIQQKTEIIKLNNMAFEFTRRGEALKYDIVPSVYEDTIHIKLRSFERIENVKSGDIDFLIGKNRMPNVSFSDIVGADKIKEEAVDFISFLKNPKSFVAKGLKAPKGLLLHGPAGTGKTYMAKAIAHEAGVPFIATNGGDIKMGTKEKNGVEILKQYFEVARRYAPSILFIDEMETIGLNRTGSDTYGDTIVNTLLAEMDGFEGHDSNPVIVIGATNAGVDAEHAVDGRYLDAAVERRFTRKFRVELPAKDDRMTFLKRSTGLPEDELEIASQMSQGLSYGKMSNAVEIAKRQALRSNRELTRVDVENAIETDNFGEVKKCSDASRERTAHHEAGHAAFGCILGGEYIPDHATILSRGDFGGYVSTAISEDDGVFTKKQLENKICSSLAGRCAEIIIYGEDAGLTTGASSDIEVAYRLVHEMVCHWGMDDKFGLVYFPDVYNDKILPVKVQEHVNELLNKYYWETIQILKDNRSLIEDIAAALLKNEALSRKELIAIKEKHNA